MAWPPPWILVDDLDKLFDRMLAIADHLGGLAPRRRAGAPRPGVTRNYPVNLITG